VVSTPLKNISQLGSLFPVYGKKKTCSKPPARIVWSLEQWRMYLTLPAWTTKPGLASLSQATYNLPWKPRTMVWRSSTYFSIKAGKICGPNGFFQDVHLSSSLRNGWGDGRHSLAELFDTKGTRHSTLQCQTWQLKTLWLVVFRHPSEKYDFVSWDDDIPDIWKNKTCSKPPTRWIMWINNIFF
jgi:hypothetical protein